MSPTALQYNLNNERFVTSQSGIDWCLFELLVGVKNDGSAGFTALQTCGTLKSNVEVYGY